MRSKHRPSQPLRLAAIGAVFALPWMAAAPAQAAGHYEPCDRAPTEAEIAAAKGAFQAGSAAYNEADYDRAVTYWEDAFRRDCTATALLLNLARAYESAGDIETAIVALTTYNERNPDSPQLSQIEKRIERLRKQKAEEDAQAEAKAQAEAEKKQKRAANQPPPAEPSEEGQVQIVPLVVAGLGGAVAVVGSVLYFQASSELKELEDECPNRVDCPPPIARAGNNKRSDMQLWGGVSIAGVAVGAGGLLWYILASDSDKTDTAHAPAGLPVAGVGRLNGGIAPGFAGVQLSGAF